MSQITISDRSFSPTVTQNTRGENVVSFGAKEIRAKFRAEGLTGRALTAAVNSTLREYTQKVGAGRVSAIIASGGILTDEKTRPLANGTLRTTFIVDTPPASREEELANKLARVQELLQKMGSPEGLTSEEQSELAKIADVKH